MAATDEETTEQWALINTPLGEEWSGRARYAAAHCATLNKTPWSVK